MADKQAKAQRVYKTMVKALKGKNWHFEEREQDLTIVSNYTGDDLPVKFIIRVDAEREVIQYLSPLPFKMEESKRVDAAVAVCVFPRALRGVFCVAVQAGFVAEVPSCCLHQTLLAPACLSCVCHSWHVFVLLFLYEPGGRLQLHPFGLGFSLLFLLYAQGRAALTVRITPFVSTALSWPIERLCLTDFALSRWRFPATLRITLPLAETLKRFAMDFLVFCIVIDEKPYKEYLLRIL